MRRTSFALSTVSALVISLGCGLAPEPADAFPATPVEAMGAGAGPLVQRAAHDDKQWRWEGGWWRRGPWADHRIYGFTLIRPPRPGGVFLAWGPNQLHHCAARYRSFDPLSGTYLNSRGERRICR